MTNWEEWLVQQGMVLPSSQAGEMAWQEFMNFKRRGAKSCTWAGTTPCTNGATQHTLQCFRKGLWGPGGNQVEHKPHKCVSLLQRKPKAPWAALGSAASRLREMVLPFCTAVCTQSTVSSSGCSVQVDKELLERVWEMKKIKGLEHLCSQERLRELGLFILEKTQLEWDLINVGKYAKGGAQRTEPGSLRGARWQDKVQWAQHQWHSTWSSTSAIWTLKTL